MSLPMSRLTCSAAVPVIITGPVSSLISPNTYGVPVALCGVPSAEALAVVEPDEA